VAVGQAVLRFSPQNIAPTHFNKRAKKGAFGLFKHAFSSNF